MKILVWVEVSNLDTLRRYIASGTIKSPIKIWHREPGDHLDVVQVQLDYTAWYLLSIDIEQEQSIEDATV
jgi:hypothetical protein